VNLAMLVTALSAVVEARAVLSDDSYE